MKAQAKEAFNLSVLGKEILIKKGESLDVILDEKTNDESGEIQYKGLYICDIHSPFAKSRFFILDDNELQPVESDENKLERIKNTDPKSLTPSDIDWLLYQAKKSNEYKESLEKISNISTDTHSAIDAAYWALLALGRV